MASMNLAEAFALYGAEVSRRGSMISAVASDGAIILGCSSRGFRRPAAGVLRYDDVFSTEGRGSGVQRALREHLEIARNGERPVRLVIIMDDTRNGTRSRTVHIRQDLVGTVVDLDENRYVVDFVRVGDVK